jgi:hypothetical protein
MFRFHRLRRTAFYKLALLLDGAKPADDAEVNLGSVDCAGDDSRHALVHA